MNGVIVKTSSGSRYFLSNDQSIRQKSRSQMAAIKDMASAKPGATITLTRMERERQAKAAKEVMQQAKPRATISLFGITLGDDGTAPMPAKSAPAATKKPTTAARKAPRGVPTINKWRKNRDGSVTGLITGSPNFSENERITTSEIKSGALSSGSVVTTGSGSKYFLS
jgi:hypothetical protein